MIQRPRPPAKSLIFLGGLAASLFVSASVAEPIALRRAEVALAEGVYFDEFWRDPAEAADQYQVVLSEANATRSERHEAAWRLGRAWRRMNRPAESRAQLGTLLIDSELPEDVRLIVERELQLLPRSLPAQIMPGDSLVYLEIPQPGIFLERCIQLANQAGLERALGSDIWSLSGMGVLSQFGPLNVRPFWNRSLRAELAKLDALGIAWRDFRFPASPAEATSEVVCALYTGETVTASDALEGVLREWLAPQQSVNGLLVPTGLSPQLHLLVGDGLLLLSSSVEDASKTLVRHERAYWSDSLSRTVGFSRKPIDWPPADGAFFFVNWQPLLKDLLAGSGKDEAGVFRATAELLGLDTIGSACGVLRLRGDQLSAEVMLELQQPSSTLGRVLQTPSLPEGWSRWVPDDAWFAHVLALGDGAQRWEAIHDFTDELDAYWRQTVDPSSVYTFADAWAEFERRSGLDIAKDLCRDVQTVTVVAQSGLAEESSSAPWVYVLEVQDAEEWVRRLVVGLGRLLSADADAQGLPISVVDTSQGKVQLLPVPGGAGLAWQVRGNRVVVAIGIDALLRYLLAVPSTGGSDYAPDGGNVCKYWRGQYDVSLIETLSPVAPSFKNREQIPSFELWTKESADQVHIILRQHQPHLALSRLASEWLELPAAAGSARTN